MARHIAFLRGVTPSNARSADLQGAFEAAGFTRVKTVLASGNVVFDARAGSEAALQARAEQALQAGLGRGFATIVRASAALQAFVDSDPFRPFDVPPQAKRVVTFLREPALPKVALPLQADGAQVLALLGREALTAYLPSAKGPVFMQLIERAFGAQVTTRTWQTLLKCLAA